MASRPSFFSRTRAVAAKETEDDETSASPVSYRRRFPKLGSQYQAKVPKQRSTNPYQVSRPRPVLMSNQIPHLTKEEAQLVMGDGKSPEAVSSGPSSLSKSVVVGCGVPTSSGTALRSGYEAYPLPIAPTLGTSNAFAPTSKTDQHQNQWIAALLDWHEAQEKAQLAASGRGRKSRFKRPREVPAVPDLPSPKVQALQKHFCDEGATKQVPVAQQQWCLLVGLSAGQASKRIRERKRSRKELSPDLEEATIPQWRQIGRCSKTNVKGDYRIQSVDPSHVSAGDVPTISNQPPQSVWKAVLACARSYQRRIANGPPLSVSALVSLCEHSSKLQSPEKLWPDGDSFVGEVNAALDSFVNPIQMSQKLCASWMDLWHKEGVELDVLRKALKQAESSNVRPNEYRELQRQVEAVAGWQSRVDQIKSSPRSSRNDLEDLETLYEEAKPKHAFRSKGLLALEARLQKAYELRDKIEEWKKTVAERQKAPDKAVPLESVKFLSSLVREITRLKLKFPAACFVLEVSERAEAWIERANIAIRSRISLDEIKSLIERGQDIPLELTEYLDKLRARQKKAQEWLDRLSEHVPMPNQQNPSLLAWMKVVRAKLDEGGSSVISLHDISCEGNRIPVEMDFSKLLQIELDARNWTSKARTWIPDEASSDSCKKAKLEEIREHMEKAEFLRGRLVLSADEKKQWLLDGELELQRVVDDVDGWFEEYRAFLENDSRRGGRPEISISVLREIVEKANSIHVNIGPASVKMAKILSQAEKWCTTHKTTLERCCPDYSGSERVSVDTLKEAAKEAGDTINVMDLKEAKDLEKLVERVEAWHERATVAIGKKKLRGKQKIVFSVEDLNSLIKEAGELPVETSTQVSQLQVVVQSVSEWKARVIMDIAAIAEGFLQLRADVDARYGPAESFSSVAGSVTSSGATVAPKSEPSKEEATPSKSSPEAGASAKPLGLGITAEILVKNMSQEAKTSCLVTEEAAIAQQLEDVHRWTSRSLKYIENPREIFDARYFGAFDRFLAEGKSLSDAAAVGEEDPVHEKSLCWRNVVCDQLVRMNALLKERANYLSWCERAEHVLAGNDKKLTVEKLRELLRESGNFPTESDAVTRIKELTRRCDAWILAASSSLQAKEKMSLQEAKAMLDEGNRFGVLSNELRMLRSGVKAARSWATKAKRCKLDQAQQFRVVKSLLDEYDSLIVSLPEEYNRLSHAMKNYCVCRRPFDGFMIQCTVCDDWFHGACVGITQARAEKKPDKYVCARCLVAKVFQSSSTCISAILRKWTNEADLKKARTAEAQKHQRKIRKETKELEKLRAEAEEITQALSKQSNPVRSEAPIDTTPQSGAAACAVLVAGQPEPPMGTVKPPQPDSQEELAKKIEKVTSAIRLCQSKLQDLADAAVQQRNEEAIENIKADVLKKWCIRVRSLVLAPSTEEQAVSSRPPTNGNFSPPMLSLLQEAERHGLTRYADVKAVTNAFKCLCWSAQAMDMLAKQPKASEAVASVRLASSLKLPDEKGLRMIKAMAQRATSWNFKASRLLMPSPGETRSYDMKELRHLSELADDIPLKMPLEPRVQAVIEDEGSRHCMCGGPSDGRLMLSCDRCERWFHAHCVGIAREDVDQIGEWKCPPCRGESAVVSQDLLRGFHDAFGREEEEESVEEDYSPKAPRAEKLWPPFGLLGSPKAVESLGAKLCSFPDDLGSWETLGPTEVVAPGRVHIPTAPTIVAKNSTAVPPASVNTTSVAVTIRLANATPLVTVEQSRAVAAAATLTGVASLPGQSEQALPDPVAQLLAMRQS